MEHDFFKMVSVAELYGLLETFERLETELAPLAECHERFLAEELESGEDLPLADRSCMDGYAVRAADVFGASESNPALLECIRHMRINERPDFALKTGQCVGITTGGLLPEGADAVVMVEHTEVLTETVPGDVELYKSVAPGDNVMRTGEDARTGEVVLEKGRRLRFQEIGLLAALGILEAPVHRRPRAGIVSTGDELVPVEARPEPGQVRDVNSSTLACLVRAVNAEARTYGLVRDNLEDLVEALRLALEENDLVLISGGSSLGMRDLTIEAMEALDDSKILAHGVGLRPGKPTILARIGGKPVLGLPGQVVSAQVVMLLFGQPLLKHLAGGRKVFDPERRTARTAVLAHNLPSQLGREDYVRVGLEYRPGRVPLAVPRSGKSGLLKTLVEAEGVVRIPADVEGLNKETLVDVWIL